MGHYCQHGTYIHESFWDCSECLAEHDAAEAADAARDAAEEAREQRQLLEDISRKISQKGDRETALESEISRLRREMEQLKQRR